MSVKLSMGTKKRTFRSITAAASNAGVPYMTFYMRVRKLGWKVATAHRRPVRPYTQTA